MDTKYLTLEEAAALLRICKSTLYKKTSLREIPFYKPGGKLILFLRDDLERFLETNRFESKETIQTNYLEILNTTKWTTK